MNNKINYAISEIEGLEIFIFLSFFLFVFPVIIFFLNNLSIKFGILDFPGKRKKHKKPMPLSGGMALVISTVFVYICLFAIGDKNLIFYNSIIISSIVFFLFGLYDDIKIPSTKLKIISLIFLIFITIILEESFVISVLNFKFLFNKSFLLENFSIFFTIFCIFMFFNALNYTDGKNGISISYSIFVLLYLINIQNINNTFLLMFIVSLIILFFFNLNNKLFLGNSGVNFLSIFISLLIIKIYNYNIRENFFCDEIFLLMLIPGIDAGRVTLYRIYKKISPFSPDNKHFHHYLERYISDNFIWVINLFVCVMPIFILKFTDNFLLSISVPIVIYFLLIFISRKIEIKS